MSSYLCLRTSIRMESLLFPEGIPDKDIVHHVAVHRTRIHLTRRRGAPSVSSFIFGHSTVAACLYVAVSKKAPIMVAVQTVRAAADVVELSVPILNILQISPFHDSRSIMCCTILKICLSSRVSVTRGCWDPAWLSIWLSWTRWFHISIPYSIS